jgi:hypothetical protein
MTTSALTMAAMMLPGAVPTLLRRAGDGVAALALAQKVVPPRAALDVLIALAIVVLGVVIVLAPDSVPGAMPSAM